MTESGRTALSLSCVLQTKNVDAHSSSIVAALQKFFATVREEHGDITHEAFASFGRYMSFNDGCDALRKAAQVLCGALSKVDATAPGYAALAIDVARAQQCVSGSDLRYFPLPKNAAQAIELIERIQDQDPSVEVEHLVYNALARIGSDTQVVARAFDIMKRVDLSERMISRREKHGELGTDAVYYAFKRIAEMAGHAREDMFKQVLNGHSKIAVTAMRDAAPELSHLRARG